MTRATSAEGSVTFLFVLNSHLAHKTFLRDSFPASGEWLPVPGGLLALAMGNKCLPLSLKKWK